MAKFINSDPKWSWNNQPRLATTYPIGYGDLQPAKLHNQNYEMYGTPTWVIQREDARIQYPCIHCGCQAEPGVAILVHYLSGPMPTSVERFVVQCEPCMIAVLERAPLESFTAIKKRLEEKGKLFID